jgi:hypothetical protein
MGITPELKWSPDGGRKTGSEATTDRTSCPKGSRTTSGEVSSELGRDAYAAPVTSRPFLS